ncbi:hypothetical protein KR044_008040 [Drosophila immigrans]|nr:hypothetical protein KR044_008040 [Drosophila immigrans]
MKLSIRTLDQRTICVDLSDDTQNVLQLKQRLVQLPEVKQPVEQLQLVYAGRIMQDEQPLKQYNIMEDKFIVLMSKRIDQVKAPTEGTNEGEERVKDDVKESKAEPPLLLPVVSPPTLTPNEQRVRDLMEMGYEEPQVRAALQASFNHPERAIEYLISGIPSSQAAAAAGSTPSPAAASAPGSTPDLTAERLQHLASDPRFAHVRDMIRQHPQLLEMVLAHLSESDPRTFEAIRSHQDEFIAMLNGGSPETEAEATQLSGEEEAAVQRLMALGFDRATVLQVYVACDKNEELAADILISQAEDEDED